MSTVYGQYAAYGFGPTTSDDWRDDASCREVDPELFFPVGVGMEHQVALAVRVCNGCSVKDTCLAWALENNVDDGIWGGATEFQRRRIKRLSAKAASDV